MKKIIVSLFIVVAVLTLVGCGKGKVGEGAEKGDTVTFRLATPDPDSSQITKAAQEFAKLVEEKSDGSIQINVHANGSLYGGDPAAAVKQLGDGSLDMLLLSTSLYTNFEPRFNAISIPYLFDDTDQFVDFLNSDLSEELLHSVEDMDIKGLGYWTREFRQITNSVQPITDPADLDGIKLRVPNNSLWVEFFADAGTATTPMDFGEVYNALQLGTIDGQENPVEVVESSKMQEVQEYLTISNHMAEAWLVGMNQEKFKELSEEQQGILLEASQEIQSWNAEEEKAEAEEMINLLEEEGMQVNELTDEQQEVFIENSKQLYPAFKEIIGDEAFFDEVLEFVGKEDE
ncbi:DctP family TRAP transporter solute-binding subunit [Oceanobacillus jeddahense]|uniref:DctP family TRAP transporter solute-binding subunit n=1 Tax=Oceanobacillus jeddahense TaxID=1462527 RepID=UPI000ACDDB0E|nr:DctP family TRAP transporter solute-binding subunit [Oceanobacillus jeddahense]